MKIDFDVINREKFQVQPNIYGTLVLPLATTHTWDDSELHLRSLLCDDNGNVVSSGFKKFFNYGEKPDRDAKMLAVLEDPMAEKFGAVKFDGTLIIRDVVEYNGSKFVWLRTRGSYHLGEFYSPVMRLIKEKYPVLLDSDFNIDCSTLFEYISPENQIVVRYLEEDLKYIGQIDANLHFFPAHVVPDARLNPVDLVEFDTFDSLQAKITKAEGEEGVVIGVKLDGDWMLTKVKSDWWRKLAYYKEHFGNQEFKNLVWFYSLFTEEKFKEYIFSVGGDFELFSFLLPRFNQIIEDLRQVFLKYTQRVLEFKAEGGWDYPTRADLGRALKGKVGDKIDIYQGNVLRLIGKDFLGYTSPQYNFYEREYCDRR